MVKVKHLCDHCLFRDGCKRAASRFAETNAARPGVSRITICADYRADVNWETGEEYERRERPWGRSVFGPQEARGEQE